MSLKLRPTGLTPGLAWRQKYSPCPAPNRTGWPHGRPTRIIAGTMQPAKNLIEQIAAVGDYLVALETYRAAVKRWPKDKITLRNRARVIERS